MIPWRRDRDAGGANPRNRGVALIAVLWIGSLLAFMAASAGSGSRADLRLARNQVERAQAQALADAGIHQALHALLTDPEAQPWRRGRITRGLALGDGEIRLRVSDEDGKIDLNAASDELLLGLAQAIGLDGDRASILIDRMLDYRDSDGDPRPRGAEDDVYLAAGRTAGAADRAFMQVAELSAVIGMTDEIYRRLKPHVTVHADADGLDPSRAMPTTLQALPGITPELAITIANQPSTADPFASLPEDVADEADAYLLPSRELMFTVESLGISAGGARFLREAVIALDGGARDLPFTIHGWSRGRPPPPDTAPSDR